MENDCILIVDDEERMRKLIKDFLKQKIFQQTKSYKLQIITITFFSPSETHFDMRLSFFLFFF